VNLAHWIVWGFGATVLLTTLLAGSQALGLTRMSLPYLLGTMLVPDRDRARAAGIAIHLVNGWIFALAYVGIFHGAGVFTPWFGALVGLLHGLFVAAVVLPAMPGIHPRMASPTAGPTALRALEPPGPFGTHYGLGTPLVIIVAHAAFGLVLGAFYVPLR
jgi:uncharacterized membrane protein YagU involved in acid resistance